MKNIFQPEIQLVREPDGEYSVYTATLCPHSGYSAGRAYRGAPPSVRLVGEAFPVTLHLHARRGHALQVLTTVRHYLRNLRLGPDHGKTSVVAFAVLHGDVVGSSSMELRPSHECQKKDGVTVDTVGWYAWLGQTQSGPAALHVSGVVHLPSPGYEARLVKAAPQGINPRELILDLEVTPRPGIWPQVISPASVRYDESEAAVAYTGVLIREPDGDSVHLDVDLDASAEGEAEGGAGGAQQQQQRG